MIAIDVPGRGAIQLHHLVLDVNGTLSTDGHLLEGVAESLQGLKGQVNIHLLTADTYGRQGEIDRQLELTAVRLQPGAEAEQKGDYVRRLGADHTAAIGQGANDALMLKAAVLGIAVLGEEGTAVEALLNADIVIPTIHQALRLLAMPSRIKATLRR